jgi:phosphinothricin acetyltransferase
MMTFRDATLDDLKAIVEIYNSTVASRLVTADTSPVSVESKMEWFRKHSPATHPLWVVEQNQRIIAWVAFHAFVERPAYHATAEISIYIHENYRRQGLGKKILAHAIEESKRLGLKTLLGYIFSHNEPSIRLFKFFGFEPWGHFPNVAELDGIERSVTIFGKRIVL